ncbi:undecaprenyl-diphosphate phosphatase [Tuberibacillus sp. Marseille-P3662]|uniref:undecaprenyl-diphosphate phosphatase n=1 Tax=Tuberibacillus sp. Marseille-P3662 TaxID=1965358 RepID=UPI000A1C9D17|nr:undecaprenyl-diphosphate phosphatase [Tuberibacillus sp. Marseille-P3662]
MEELLTLIKYAFLGLVQGFTEPIPISSSGHLVIIQELLNMDLEGLTFEIFVNFASLFAVLIIYRRDLIRLIKNGIAYLTTREASSKSDFMFIIYLIVGTIPAGVLGVLFGDVIEEQLSKVSTVGVTLIITGIALWIIRNLRGRKADQDLSFKDAAIVGLGQAIALIPGISRSGGTIVAAMGRGMKQDTALRFSFMLYIPVSLGTGILSISDLINSPDLASLWMPYLIGFVISLIASYFSLKWLINVMANGRLGIFSIYCVIVGALVLIFLT